jgi:putative YhdH/YhfP family quinone oxidoreductase
MGVGADGGFAEFVSVPARYVTVLATPLNARRAIIFGLAGYTAVASILALEARGAVPGNGEILVTGATGGVGSLAVALLARRGHSVVASTGSAHHREWLTQLGASEVIGRDEIADRPDRVLGTERWAGAVDCVGGNTLTQILRSLRYGAAVAASGLVAGADLATTIYPFITRGVALLGVDAVETTSEQRSAVWDELARLSRRDDEQLVERTIALTEVAEGLSVIGAGATHGRWLVELNR